MSILQRQELYLKNHGRADERTLSDVKNVMLKSDIIICQTSKEKPMNKISTQLLKRLQQHLFKEKDTCFITYEMLRRTYKRFSEVLPPLKVVELSPIGQLRYKLCKSIRSLLCDNNTCCISHEICPDFHSTGKFVSINMHSILLKFLIIGCLHVETGRFCYNYYDSTSKGYDSRMTENIDILIQTFEPDFLNHMSVTYVDQTSELVWKQCMFRN